MEVAAREERGRPPPQWYLDEPPLLSGDRFYLDAFHTLGTCRQIGYALGPIPWTAIRQYAVNAGLDAEMAQVFEAVIFEMDLAHAEWCERQSQTRRSMATQAPGPGGPDAEKVLGAT